jgi:hypothetical protein
MNAKIKTQIGAKLPMDFTETKFLVPINYSCSARRDLYASRSTPQFFGSPVAFNAPRHGVQCSQGLNNNKNSK